jgi:hypothetical protein
VPLASLDAFKSAESVESLVAMSTPKYVRILTLWILLVCLVNASLCPLIGRRRVIILSLYSVEKARGVISIFSIENAKYVEQQ